jgi:hypothetical protein
MIDSMRANAGAAPARLGRLRGVDGSVLSGFGAQAAAGRTKARRNRWSSVNRYAVHVLSMKRCGGRR